VAEARIVLAPLLGVDAKNIEFSAASTDTKVHDADVLADLGVGTFGVLSLRITDPPNARLRRDAGDILTAPPPDVLTVLVRRTKEKRTREVVVEVQRAGGASAKPFLGGLRDVCSGVTFHHAATQTDRVDRASSVPQFSRDTQAGIRRHQATATLAEHIVQTDDALNFTGAYIVLRGDAERFEADRMKRFRSACILQRCLRTWVTKRKEQRAAEAAEATPTPHFPEEQSVSDAGEPDIQTLLNAVYEWRREEEERLQKITAVLTQRAERLDVLAEEARRLAQVDAVRVQRREARRRRRQEALLRKAARPKSWRGYKGRRLEADTPLILRYRRLLELYETTIQAWNIDPDSLWATADALEELTEIMTTSDIIRLETLLRRRAAYLERRAGVEGTALLERVRDLFLEVAQIEQSGQPPVATCRSCGRPLPARNFAHSMRTRSMRRCATCTRLSTAPWDLATDNKLKRLTEMMRKHETNMPGGLKLPAGSQPAFMLQPEDIRLLATRIWPGRSVLGGALELERLRFGRWDCWKPFSPWNCVLLTSSELTAHVRSTVPCGPEMVYAPPLIARIRRRHLQASLRFRLKPSGAVSELDEIREIDDGDVLRADVTSRS